MNPSKTLISKLLFISIFIGGLLFFPCSSCAQEPANGFLYLENKLIEADNGDLISIDIKISNNKSTQLKGFLKIHVAQPLDLISKNEIYILQSPGESEFHSIKVQVSRNTPANEKMNFNIELTDSLGNSIEKMDGQIKVNETKHVDFFILENNLQIRNSGEVLDIPIRLHNTGNTTQKVTVNAKFPRLRSNDVDEYISVNLSLSPFLDTTFDIKKIVSNTMLAFGDIEITLNCIYDNGDIAGISAASIQSLLSKRKFRNPLNNTNLYLDNNISHTLEISGQFLFSPYETYLVRASSDILFDGSKSKLSYSVDGQFWKNSAQQSFFRNTYLSYENNNKGITVGNITRSFDLNLIGRGVSAFIADSSKLNSVEVGWIDESYNLFQKNNISGYDNGKAWWANINIDKGIKGIKSTFIHQANSFFNERHMLFSNQLWYKVADNMTFTGFLNGAYTETFTSDISRYSAAGGLNFEGKFNKLLFTSENYTSSPYYPGIKRGSNIFSQRFIYTGKRSNVSFEYTFNSFGPKFINNPGFVGSEFISQKVEMGISGNFSNHFGYTFSPIYYTENNKLPNGGNLFLEADIISLGANFRLNYFNYQKKQYLYFNAESGFYQTPLTKGTTNLFHFKSNSTLQFGMFSLNLFSQIGEFYASEVLGKSFQNVEQINLFNITPQIQTNLFNNKVHIEGGVTYITSNVSPNGLQLTGRGEYNFNLRDKFYISYQKYQYNAVLVNIADFRMGIIKQIPDLHIQSGRKTMNLFFYKDLNGNKKFDASDSVAQDFIVFVNKDLLITNSKGRAFFKHLPRGNYTISAPPSKGWYAPEQIIHLSENQNISVALNRNAVLRGKINYEKEQFVTYEVNKKLDGVLVSATNSLGVVYKTKTRESGNFVFFIPPGEYTIEINNSNLPEKIVCANCNQSINVELNSIPVLEFNFAIKERIYKVQKFTSPNIKNN